MPSIKEIGERRAALSESWSALSKTRNELEEKLLVLEAQIMQLVMLELAEKNPETTGYRYDTEYVYDDEDGYFWTCYIYTICGDEDDDNWDANEVVRQWAGEKSLPVAFESDRDDAGEITVARLREIVAGHSLHI